MNIALSVLLIRIAWRTPSGGSALKYAPGTSTVATSSWSPNCMCAIGKCMNNDVVETVGEYKSPNFVRSCLWPPPTILPLSFSKLPSAKNFSRRKNLQGMIAAFSSSVKSLRCVGSREFVSTSCWHSCSVALTALSPCFSIPWLIVILKTEYLAGGRLSRRRLYGRSGSCASALASCSISGSSSLSESPKMSLSVGCSFCCTCGTSSSSWISSGWILCSSPALSGIFGTSHCGCSIWPSGSWFSGSAGSPSI